MIQKLLVALLCFSPLGMPPLFAETAMLECVADLSLPTTDGHSPELRLPHLILLNFRFAAVKDWAVIKATLLLHVAGGDALTKLDISTITEPWSESRPAPLHGKKLNFLSHSVELKEGGWIAIEVTPSLVELLTAGKGTGLAVRDRSSSKKHTLHSRESVQFTPYLIVDGKPR